MSQSLQAKAETKTGTETETSTRSRRASAGDLIDDQVRHAAPLLGMAPVTKPRIPRSVPKALRNQIETHRALLAEVLHQTSQTGNERAVTICGEQNSHTSGIIDGGPTSVQAVPCASGELSVVYHAHPDSIANPILSLPDVHDAISGGFDWVVVLGSHTSEAVHTPTPKQLKEMKQAGFEKGLRIRQQITGKASSKQIHELRQIYKAIRKSGAFSRFRSGFLRGTAHQTSNPQSNSTTGSTATAAAAEIGLPDIQLLPTKQTISISDQIIKALVSAFTTVILFRLVFGGSPEKVVGNLFKQATGTMPQEMAPMQMGGNSG